MQKVKGKKNQARDRKGFEMEITLCRNWYIAKNITLRRS